MWWGELVAPWCADVLWIPYGMIYDPLEATMSCVMRGDGPHDVMRDGCLGNLVISHDVMRDG